MKEMRRVLALLLCAVMLVGYVPAGAFAAETETTAPSVVEETPVTEAAAAAQTEAAEEEAQIEEEITFDLGAITAEAVTGNSNNPDGYVDAALFFSDLHVDKSEYNKKDYSPITNVFGTIAAESGFDFSSVTSIGDAYAVNESNGSTDFTSTTADLTAAIAAALNDANGYDLNYTWSDHDRRCSDIEDFTGLVYSGPNYYIYAISMSDTSTYDRYKTGVIPASDKELKAALDQFTADVEAMDHTKPMFIACHQPLLDNRNDNGNAYEWAKVINAAAEDMDIVFLFGHNHGHDKAADYYYAKGAEMKVCKDASGNYETVKLNFTHACAGYLAPTTSGSANREGVAVVAEIDKEAIYLTTYNKSGVYTGNYALVEQEIKRDHAAPSISTVTYEDETTVVTATAPGLTAINVSNHEGDIADFGQREYIALDIALSGHNGDEVTYTIQAVDGMNEDLRLFHVGTDGKIVELSYTSEVKDGFTVLTFTTSRTGTFAYGLLPGYIPADAVLTGLTVVSEPEKKYYFPSQDSLENGILPLDITGLEVKATYTSGGKTYEKPLIWNEFKAEEDAYALAVDMTTPGEKVVTVSYCGLEATFKVWICQEQTGNEELGADVVFDAPAVLDLTVELAEVTETITNAVAGLLKGELTVFSFTPVYTDSENIPEFQAEITLPIPEGVEHPVVYYVSPKGETEHMESWDNGDGTLTFVTSHFSAFVVGDDPSLEVPEGEVVKGTGTVTDTTTKTVYVLVNSNSITAGEEYLIADSNSASSTTSRHLLRNNSGSVAATAVTVRYGDVNGDGNSETYIELDDASDVLWEAGSGYTFRNNGHYLYYSSGLNLNSNDSTNWSYTSSRLKISNQKRYLRYYNGWTTTTSSYSATNIYFYVPTVVEVESQVPANGTYEIVGDPEVITGFAVEGYKCSLGSILTFTPDDPDQDVQYVEHTATYEIYNDPNGIIATNGVNNNDDTVTLSGKLGQALIQVTATVDGETVTNYILVNSIAKPTMQIHEYPLFDENGDELEDIVVGDEITTTIGLTRVDAATEYSVYAMITSGGVQIDPVTDARRLRWSSSNTAIATVEGFDEEFENGMIYFTGKEAGTVTITATYLDEQGNVLCSDSITFNVELKPFIVPGDGTNDFPEYPDEGAVRFDKSATALGTYSESGIAQVEIAMTGVPYSKGVDVVVVVDTSSSMKYGPEGPSGKDYNYGEGSRYYIMKQSLGDMLNVFAAADSEGRRPDIDLAIVDFNGYSTSSSVSNAIPGANLNDRSTDRTGTNYGSIYTGTGNGTQVRNLANGINSLGAEHFENTGSDAFNTARINEILDYFDGGHSGTNYDFGIEAAYKLLAAKKAANTEPREQYVIFLTDGAPFRYNGFTCDNSNGRLYMDRVLDGYYKDSAELLAAYPSYGMTEAVAAMYDPYNGTHRHRMAEAIKGEEGKIYQVVDHTATTPYLKDYEGLGAKFYSIGFCIADDDYGDPTGVVHAETSHKVIRTLSSGAGYYWENVTDRSQLSGAFTKIAKSIVEAATNAVVEDKIGSAFSLNLSVPGYGTKYAVSAEKLADMTDFDIQVVEYHLDANKERTDDYDVLERFVFNPNGSVKSHIVHGAETCGSDCSHVAATSETVTNTDTGATTTVWTTTSITGTYFQYVSDANGEILTWNSAKISTTELALQYYAHLDNSSGVPADQQVPAGTHNTNEYATLTYDNYKGNRVQQTFPVPQMTWNGAQVSYVFYLVNDAGQPVNRAGRVVPFAEAVYVTDVTTEHVVWNDLEQTAALEAQVLAHEKVPTVYQLFDPSAKYNIHVFEDEDAQNLNNHFVISGAKDVNTTYVFIKKSDTVKYSKPGTYSATSDYLCKEYAGVTITNEYTDASGVMVYEGTYSGTGKQHIKNGHAIYGKDNIGDYTIVEKSGATEVRSGFDFSDTTVAFGVVWVPELQPDTVVVDYGLDVSINVLGNDSKTLGVTAVTAVMAQKPENVTIDGRYDTSVGTTEIEQENWSAEVDSTNNNVVFSQNTMLFKEPVTFYYEASIEFLANNDDTEMTTTYMYSSVNVIPATTIYYEDNFLKLESYTKTGGTWQLDEESAWNAPAKSETTQQMDRPGVDDTLGALDANNNYGYDSAYTSMAEHSLGSSAKITVTPSLRGEATFSFFGTGFDVIGMTSNNTGTLIVQVFEGDKAEGTPKTNLMVDTYYGFTRQACKVTMTYVVPEGSTVGEWIEQEPVNVEKLGNDDPIPTNPANGQEYSYYKYLWTAAKNTPDALYQVPVMKVMDLPYKQYTVKITASYGAIFDHANDDNQYDLYLDAIRIYNPTGNRNEMANEAYVQDKEGWPIYKEVRNSIIEASKVSVQYHNNGSFTVDPKTAELGGAIFIDSCGATTSIVDYVNYGPNNEVYLAKGQSISFKIPLSSFVVTDEDETRSIVADVQLGMKSATKSAARVHMSIRQDGESEYSGNGALSAATTTDLYYSIGGNIPNVQKDAIITLTNIGGDATIASITTLKVTFNEKPEATTIELADISGEEAAAVLTMLHQRKTAPANKVDAELSVAIREKSVKAGKNVSLQATTSDDVAYLTVNGQKITEYTENQTTGKRTWSVSLKAAEAGTLDINVTAYSADGDELETVTETVTVTAKNNGAVQQIVGQLIGMLGR